MDKWKSFLILAGISLVSASAADAQTTFVTQRAGNPLPVGSTPVSMSTTGSTAAITGTLAADTNNRNTYLCGFSIRSTATAGTSGTATVSGVTGGPLLFLEYTGPVASAMGITEETMNPCLPTSAVNTAITIAASAPGSGGAITVSAWGYQY
jgi:hypothetical protein